MFNIEGNSIIREILKDLREPLFNYCSTTVSIFEDWGDYEKKDGKLILKLAKPGYKKEDFKIKFDGNSLRVAAQIKEETSFRKNFEASFAIKSDVKRSDIEATYADGILVITLPLATTEEDSEITVK